VATDDAPRPSAVSDDWAGLLPYEKAAAWRKVNPELAQQLVEESRRQMRHERRLQWAKWSLQALTVLAGYAVAVVVGLSLVKAGHPWPGAGAFGLASAATASAGLVARGRAAGRQSKP